jgi:FkbM family methyltransferase
MDFDWAMGLERLVLKRIVPTILSRPIMQPFNQLMFRLALSGMGLNNWSQSRDERRMLFRLRRRLPADPVIFNIGANDGQFAILALAAFPKAKVQSFEPNPAAFRRLLARHFPVAAVNAGCGDKPGRLSLFDASADAGSELATFVGGIIDNAVSIDAEIVTVDEYCDANGIERIDLLKMDVEGFEAVVLRGSQRMLSERRVPIV